MTQDLEISRDLENILEMIIFCFQTMIKVQKAEDAAPDPPDFLERLRDFNLTWGKQAYESFKETAEQTPEKYSPRGELVKHIAETLLQLPEMQNIQDPDRPTGYPAKTEAGKDLEELAALLGRCKIELFQYRLANQAERERAINVVSEQMSQVKKQFPKYHENLEKIGELDHLRYVAFYHGICLFENVPRLLSKTMIERAVSVQEQKINILRYKLWFKFYWQKFCRYWTR